MTKEQYGNITGSISSAKEAIQGTISRARTVYVRELEFERRTEFPVQGDSKYLYIATDENNLYRWSSEESEYIQLSGNSQNVLVGTSKYWDSQQTLISTENVIYIYSDYGVKIGDGTSYLSELAFATVFVSDADKSNWNDKVGAQIIGLETLELYK